MKKRVMIVAGGQWQISLVKKAKEMGCFVINSNLYKDSPAFAYADISVIADVLDIEKNMEIAMQYKPDIVLTDQSDIAVKTVAAINEKLSLNGISCEIAELFTNKYLMRKYLEKSGYPCPAYKLCENIEQAKVFLKNYREIIIKPINNQSSRGVFFIGSLKELEEQYEITSGYSLGKNVVLAEQFIGGTEFTVDGIQTEKGHYSLAISRKEHFESNRNVASSLIFSNKSEQFDYNRLKTLNNSVINGTNLSYGLTHAEYKYHNNEFYLIEAAARGGGTNISSTIVPFMTGVDNYKILIQMALRDKLSCSLEDNEIKNDYLNRCSSLDFLCFSPGRVKEIFGKEKLNNSSNVLEYLLKFKPGDDLKDMKDDSERHCHIIFGADNMHELNVVRKKYKECLGIKYENN